VDILDVGLEGSAAADLSPIAGCLHDAVTVTGHGPSRKLLFASAHGVLHFIKLEEGYGERSATLMVKKNVEDGSHWDITFNSKAILTFATHDLAMKAYTDAYQILASAFDREDEISDEFAHSAIASPPEKPFPYLFAISMTALIIVLGVFSISMTLRMADHMLPWHSDAAYRLNDIQRNSGIVTATPKIWDEIPVSPVLEATPENQKPSAENLPNLPKETTAIITK